jgi:hypothetical protein
MPGSVPARAVSRVEHLPGRSLRSRAVLAELSLALLAAQTANVPSGDPAHDQYQGA